VERRQCLTPEREFLGLVSTQERWQIKNLN
jgi:hypothetical protein